MSAQPRQGDPRGRHRARLVEEIRRLEATVRYLDRKIGIYDEKLAQCAAESHARAGEDTGGR
ncbi:hypothetical protein HNR23_001536 [Nocardiopsis mwathae]|uniref:Uncharacterized protein n=1 Tax=Nocardiopsis mwathae TaxID=1472723 RepID=A0A7W9YHT9_9ACTN|nr:hypothetical protein [Nocardiopsis mwathae]MBB6171476.1 hypothetical protein [Nocardiopsis mwathae]